MTLLDMRIYAVEELPPGSAIEIRVEMEDGPVSYAEIEGVNPPERCWASTGDKMVRWEYGTPDGDWKRCDAHDVSHSKEIQGVMARAARAGLVAAGYAS